MRNIYLCLLFATLCACSRPAVDHKLGFGGQLIQAVIVDPATGLPANVVEAGAAANGLQLAGSITPGGAAGGDLSGTYPNPQLAAIAGSSPIAITPANLQYTAATVAPLLSQATQTSDVVPPDLTIQSSGPFASAVTNLNAGNVVLNTPSPVSGNTTAMLHVKSGGTDRWQIGDCAALAGANGACMWANPVRSGTNFVLLATASGNATALNSGATLDLDVAGVVVEALTSSAITLSQPTTSSLAFTATTTSALTGAITHPSPQTIACGTGGTQTVAASPSSGLLVTSGTLGSNCVIDFGTNATNGDFTLDMSGVTLGATFGVQFKNGTQSSTVITSGNVLAGDTLAKVWTHGANTLAVQY